MKDTGGSAFPTEHVEGGDRAHKEGMTLRDYFAGQVSQGFISQLSSKKRNDDFIKICLEDDRTVEEGIAYTSYLIADAMIAERNK